MVRLVYSILLALALGGCILGGEDDWRNRRFDYTAADSSEAILMALDWSAEIEAPPTLVATFLHDLAAIRAKYGGEVVKVDYGGGITRLGDIRFRAPWTPSHITIRFDEATVAAIDAGSYRAWDRLNDEYGLVQAMRRVSYGGAPSYRLEFADNLHPCRLVEAYAGLPGATSVEATGRGGDGPNVFPFRTNGGWEYVVYNGWGDCPEGCISDEFRRFGITGIRAYLIDEWSDTDTDAPPVWVIDRFASPHSPNDDLNERSCLWPPHDVAGREAQ